MNDNKQILVQLKNFLESDERGLLLTGTHESKKQKLIMGLLGTIYKDKRILVRTHHMNNLQSCFGWTGLKKTPQIGKGIRLLNNIYCFDTIYRPDTWNKTSNNYDFAIIYPFDIIVSSGDSKAIADLYKRSIPKIFLITHDCYPDYDFADFKEFISSYLEFNIEDLAEHNRIKSCRREC